MYIRINIYRTIQFSRHGPLATTSKATNRIASWRSQDSTAALKARSGLAAARRDFGSGTVELRMSWMDGWSS